LARAKLIESFGELFVGKCQYSCSEERRIDRAGLADSESADGYTRGHLQDRKQAVLAFKRRGFHGYAKNRKRGEGCGHAGQVSGTASARYHYLIALFSRRLREFVEPIWRTMRRYNQRFMFDTKLVERRCRETHDFPVGLAAYDDGDRPLCGHDFSRSPWREKAPDYRSGRGLASSDRACRAWG